MNPNKDKLRSLGKYERQFRVPLSMEDCCVRLQMHDQRRENHHSRPKNTIEVALVPLDAETTAFQVYKPLIALDFGRPTTRAYGTLNRQADGTTLVLVNAGTTRYGYVRYWVFWLYNWVAITGVPLVMSYYSDEDVRPFIVISPALLIWILVNAKKSYPRQHCELLNVVLEALGRMRKNRHDLLDC